MENGGHRARILRKGSETARLAILAAALCLPHRLAATRQRAWQAAENSIPGVVAT